MSKLKILVLVDYYYPAYKAGGALRTIKNMVSQLSIDYDFFIITRDHDYGSNESFEKIMKNEWNYVDSCNIYYISKSDWKISTIRNLLEITKFDILYLNSFFSPWMTFLPLLLMRFRLSNNVPIVLAPRGEFSKGALKIKKLKKTMYFLIFKIFNLCDNVFWQASSKNEFEDILFTLKTKFSHSKYASKIVDNSSMLIKISPDLLPFSLDKKLDLANSSINKHRVKKNIPRLIFLSRIAPIKNLDFLLRVLIKLNLEIELSIYGPLEDKNYWNLCNQLISRMPKNTIVNTYGPIDNENVTEIFSEYDLFVFPTKGENFGHVIIESMTAGTPVFVSDQVQWLPDEEGALKVLPLNEDIWISALKEWYYTPASQLIKMREAAVLYVYSYISNNDHLELNRRLFKDLLN